MAIEPFLLERYFAKYEFKAKYMLSSSDAESMSLDDLLAYEPDIKNTLGKTWLGYSDSNGIPELREEIATTYTSIKPSQILTHTGAEEPIFNLLSSMLKSGDHVIAHFPGYQSVYSIPKMLGCDLTLWKSRFEDGWKLDLEELKRILRPTTKLVIVNFPHNPTGYIPALDEFQELIKVLREKGVMLLSDEVYRGLESPSSIRLPAACDLYERAVSLGVVSKAYGLAGLRTGWIATKDEAIYNNMASFKDYTTICNPILSEKLAAVAVRHRDAIIGRNQKIVTNNIIIAEQFFAAHADRFEWVRPLGGTMAFPRAKKNFDMELFSKNLLDRESVMLISGRYFNVTHDHFRLGLGRKNFPEVFEIFKKALG